MRQLLRLTLVLILSLSACGQPPSSIEEECEGEKCSETDINAPAPEPKAPVPAPEPVPSPEPAPAPGPQDPRFPLFDPAWGLMRTTYEKAVEYYERHQHALSNQRYVSVIDFSQHSSRKRWVLFDLQTGSVSRYLTSHGKNSDPDNDGYATLFSNTPGSRQSSIGFYHTIGTYNGSNGYSMRLKGRESSNSNAESRAIVVHPASYVQEANSYAGRSWGCPALDPGISRAVIDKIKNGSLLLIDR